MNVENETFAALAVDLNADAKASRIKPKMAREPKMEGHEGGGPRERAHERGAIGDNSHAKNGNADDRLRLLIERVERLEAEKKGIADDVKDVYAEARAVGYDAKIMRQIVRLRKMKPDDRREQDAILELYKDALGLD